MNYFLQGLTMGLAYVAPIGLQNLFVINAALQNKRGKAFFTAAAVIFFDVTLALACFFGIGALMENFPWLQKFILLIGSFVVVFIGIGLLRTKTKEISHQNAAKNKRQIVFSACIVTWCNPQAIIDGTMMLGAFSAALPPNQSIWFIFAIRISICLWFSGLTVLISVFRERLNVRVLRGINLICGVVIIFYGLKLFWSFIRMLP